MANLLLPNIAGTAMQGFQQGRNMAANRLIGLAMSNPDQSSQYFGQAAQINPGAVLDVQNAQARQQYMQGLGQVAQQKAAQAQQSADLQKIGAAARYMAGALQTNDPNKIEGAYQAVRPYLAELGQAQGKTPPPQWDPSMTSAIYHVIAQTASAFPDDMKLQTVTPGSVVTRGGEPVYSNPAAPKIVAGGDGRQYAVSPGQNGNLVASPIAVTGAGATPQVAPQSPQVGQPAPASTIDGNVPAGTQVTQATGADDARVSFAFAPGTPDAVKAQAAAAAGIPQSMPQGQTLTAPNKNTNPLTQRLQNLRQIETQFGMKLSPQQEQAFVLNGGKLDPSDFSPDGTDPLAVLSAPDRALVEKIANYELLPSDLGRGKDRQKMLAMAALVNPDYNVSNAQAANAFLKDLARSSPTSAGGQVTSLNQMMEHLNLMMNANEEMPGDSRFPLVNRITNAVTTGTGGAQVNNWNQGVAYLNQEVAKLLKGGVASESEVSELMSHLNAAGSPEQRAQALGRVAEFVYGRISALTERRDSLLGNMSPGTSLLTPSSEQALLRAFRLTGDQPPELLPPNNGTPFAQRGGQQAPQAAAQSDPALDALLKKYGGG